MLDIFLIGAVILLAIGCLIALLQVFFLRKRYEKFRDEGAAMFQDVHDEFIDIESRLTKAGYPPGRVSPYGTTTPMPGHPRQGIPIS